MNQIDQLWPGWEVNKIVGRGSFGTVYEIQRDAFGIKEKAALKVLQIPQDESEIENLRAENYDDESITQRFKDYVGDILKEYKMMIDMRGCTNVVFCEDYRVIEREDSLGWNIYIKMELLTPLMKKLDAVSTEAQIVRLGQDMCNALIDCHKKT